MTRDEVTRIALECGFELKDLSDGTKGLRTYVYEFAEKIATAEREDIADWYDRCGWVLDTSAVPAAIRARGE